jgi:hypothetical protein
MSKKSTSNPRNGGSVPPARHLWRHSVRAGDVSDRPQTERRLSKAPRPAVFKSDGPGLATARVSWDASWPTDPTLPIIVAQQIKVMAVDRSGCAIGKFWTGKAKLHTVNRNRKLIANSDRTQCSKRSLLNHLVGTAGKWQRNGDAERFGGLEIDVKLDFGYLLDR